MEYAFLVRNVASQNREWAFLVRNVASQNREWAFLTKTTTSLFLERTSRLWKRPPSFWNALPDSGNGLQVF